MSSYNNLIHRYKKEALMKNIPEMTFKAFLFELCNEKGIDLYLELDNEVDAEIEEKFDAGAKRILSYEPMNYVLGYCWFFGYRLNVNQDVLIPRYETEELIGLILAKYDEYFNGKEAVCADIGTGSGAIAIALKKEEKNLQMIATDISKEALKVAEENAKFNDADIQFFAGDMLKPLIEAGVQLDILISNPPYIPQDEVMEESVIGFEPHVALFGGEDGLKFYRSIFMDAPKVLKEDGLIFFEIGYNQKESMTALAKSYYPNAHIEVLKDMNGKDRMMFIHL